MKKEGTEENPVNASNDNKANHLYKLPLFETDPLKSEKKKKPVGKNSNNNKTTKHSLPTIICRSGEEQKKKSEFKSTNKDIHKPHKIKNTLSGKQPKQQQLRHQSQSNHARETPTSTRKSKPQPLNSEITTVGKRFTTLRVQTLI